jgi:hypothetical protein
MIQRWLPLEGGDGDAAAAGITSPVRAVFFPFASVPSLEIGSWSSTVFAQSDVARLRAPRRTSTRSIFPPRQGFTTLTRLGNSLHVGVVETALPQQFTSPLTLSIIRHKWLPSSSSSALVTNYTLNTFSSGMGLRLGSSESPLPSCCLRPRARASPYLRTYAAPYSIR